MYLCAVLSAESVCGVVDLYVHVRYIVFLLMWNDFFSSASSRPSLTNFAGRANQEGEYCVVLVYWPCAGLSPEGVYICSFFV